MKKLFKKVKIYSQNGTTIVELLLYMGLLSILLATLTSIFVSALDVQSESNATSAVEQDGNYILSRLNYDIHRAQSISIPPSSGATAGNFQIIIGGVNYTYSIDANNNLILTNNLGTDNLNNYGSSVSALLVQRLGNVGGIENTLRINFTVKSRVKRISGFETKDFKTSLSLRRQ
jgi:type II secretory pathway pseudopilin PulG